MLDDLPIDAIVRELVAGIPMPRKPDGFEGEYVFPRDATQLSDVELGQWLSQVGAYRSYANAMATVYGTAEFVLKTMLDRREFQLRRERDDGKKRLRAVMEEVAILPEVISKRDDLIKLQAYAMFFEEVAGVYGGEFETLSRELTRRRELQY